jgi:NADH:ubiquinone oxidoreductase subunit 2 (subunit N)
MDVYDDSPTIVTIWLTNMPKISILVVLLQFLIGIDVNLNLLDIGEITPSWLRNSHNILSNLLLLSSLLSLIIGAIVGLSQIKIKRLLAYSTINHIGFLLLTLAVFTSSSSNFSQSVESFIFYIIQYTLTNLNIFLIILALSYIINANINNLEKSKLESSKRIKNLENSYLSLINISDIEYINSLKGLFIKNPVLSLSLSICLFSFAGVPPLVGFFAKQQVLYSSNSAGYFFLSLMAILVSVISAFYYLKIIKIVFSMPAFNPVEKKFKNFYITKVLQFPSSSPSQTSPKTELSQIKFEILDNLLLENLILKNTNNDKGTNHSLTLFQSHFNTDYKNKNKLLSNMHSLLISMLTMFIINFIFNPVIILNSIAIIVANSLNL